MKYPNGVEVKIGDRVRFERGVTSGTVETIIGSSFADWLVDEPGVNVVVRTVWAGVYSRIDIRQRRGWARVAPRVERP